MISAECFEKEFIKAHAEALGARYIQVEKSIHALALLGHLAKTDLSFIFKGGTSLLLHLQHIKRLSIDVDIMSDETDERLEEIVNKVAVLPPFIRSEKQTRGERGQPERRHFKFFYQSSAPDEIERHVILDVVPRNNCNLACIQKAIKTEFIKTEESVLVKVLSKDALLGDKLTAFAPRTIGVLFEGADGRSMAMQVVKQLFDVGELFNEVEDLTVVSDAYLESYRLENEWRGREYSLQAALADTKNIALQLCCYDLDYENIDVQHVAKLKRGIRELESHLVRGSFSVDREAKVAAAKAYLLASYLEGSIELTVEQLSFDLKERLGLIKDSSITNPACLNSLKATVPEAFYYLALAIGI